MQDEVEQEVHMKSLTIVFALAGTLIGCASTPVKYEGDAKHSEAWNIARAAGIGDLRDVPYEKYAKAREDAMRRGQLLDDGPGVAGAVAFSALNYSSPPTGFSNGSAMLMGAIAWMGAPSKSHAINSGFFAWMPRHLAATPDEAAANLTALLVEKLKTAMAQTLLPSGYQYGEVEVTKYWLIARIDGPGCDHGAHRCGFVITKPTRPALYPAPSFIGQQGDVWAWRAYSHGSYKGVTQGALGIFPSKAEMSSTEDFSYAKTWAAGFPDLEFFKVLTKTLPTWCYVYLAPQRWSARYENRWVLPRYPVVISEGKVMYFVEPEPKATS